MVPGALSPPVQFPKITLIGVGLLGGSVGLAARERGVAGRVIQHPHTNDEDETVSCDVCTYTLPRPASDAVSVQFDKHRTMVPCIQGFGGDPVGAGQR